MTVRERQPAVRRDGVLSRAAVIVAFLLGACYQPTVSDADSLQGREYRLTRIDGDTLPQFFAVVASDSLWLRAERISFGTRVTVLSDLSTTAWPDPLSFREGMVRLDYRTSNDSLVLGNLTPCGSAICLQTWRRGLVTPDSLVLVGADSIEYRYMRRLAAP